VRKVALYRCRVDSCRCDERERPADAGGRTGHDAGNNRRDNVALPDCHVPLASMFRNVAQREAAKVRKSATFCQGAAVRSPIRTTIARTSCGDQTTSRRHKCVPSARPGVPNMAHLSKVSHADVSETVVVR